MLPIAAIPAIGLLTGCAAGLRFSNSSFVAAPALAGGAIAAVWAFRANRPAVLIAAVAVAFAGGGALLSADAWRDAWRPPLRAAFEEIVGGEDGTAFVIVTGVLRSDAVQRESGVSLSLEVVSAHPSVGRPFQGRHPTTTSKATLKGSPYAPRVVLGCF